MSRKSKKRSRKAGLPPGSLVYTGDKPDRPVKIKIFDYDNHNLREREVERVEECLAYSNRSTVTWINVEGIHDVEVIEKLGEYFGLNHLVLEDILNTEQRPKKEDHDEYIFIALRMLSCSQDQGPVQSESVDLVVGRNFVISFQEGHEGDVFEPLRDRLRIGKGKIRKLGADYLAYALIDLIVDNYFVVLESLSEQYEGLENEAMVNPSLNTIQKIYQAKKEIVNVRRAVWPVREVITGLLRDESKLISQHVQSYLRDAYDHAIEVIEITEMLRDMVAVMIDLNLTSISNRTNEVMKVLALISTIFMPLTFIAGIYGMNFEHMPELKWTYGYYLVLGVMVLTAFSLVYWFRKKQWL